MSFHKEENSGANGAIISSNGTHEGGVERRDIFDNYMEGTDAIFSIFVPGKKSKHILSSF